MIAITDRDRARITINSNPNIIKAEMIELGKGYIKFILNGHRINIPITEYTVLILDDFTNINIKTDPDWENAFNTVA